MPACLALKKLAILNLTTLLLVYLDVGREAVSETGASVGAAEHVGWNNRGSLLGGYAKPETDLPG
jgi:hypothetical protein